MSRPVASPIHRCCPTHRDWISLAYHLLAEFSDVPARAVIDELTQAQHASRLFQLENADALDCAELIVRYRILSASGRRPASDASVTPTVIAQVA
jgi:hypothetical protein